MQVKVDRELCCSSGMCVTNSPEIFDQDDRDGLVMLRQSTFRPEQFAELRLAADLCPGGAISVVEDVTEDAAEDIVEDDAARR